MQVQIWLSPTDQRVSLCWEGHSFLMLTTFWLLAGDGRGVVGRGAWAGLVQICVLSKRMLLECCMCVMHFPTRAQHTTLGHELAVFPYICIRDLLFSKGNCLDCEGVNVLSLGHCSKLSCRYGLHHVWYRTACGEVFVFCYVWALGTGPIRTIQSDSAEFHGFSISYVSHAAVSSQPRDSHLGILVWRALECN